jgi:glycosyltransferase involved in cell wall biosynthesis
MMWLIIFGATLVLLLLTLTTVLTWPRIRPSKAPEFRKLHDTLSVLIPARNEGATIEACLRSVLAQGQVVREVLVYDDCSDDDTALRVAALAQTDSRVRLIPGVPLPAGWYGKPHACMQLAQHAQSPWMMFLDADTRLSPSGAAALVETAQARNVTFLSAWPHFEVQGLAEQALMPMLNFFVFSVFPALGSLFSSHPSLGLAHGACILVERSTYLRIGGHALVSEELFEDTTLARSWREHGERGLCLDGQHIVRVRMYEGLRPIWRGFQKNFYPGFRSGATFWFFLLFHCVLFLVPFLWLPFAVTTHGVSVVVLTAAAVITMRLLLAGRFGQPLWSAFLHPFSEGFLLAVGIRSWWLWTYGHGVQWKGRSYHHRSIDQTFVEGVSRQ